MANQNENLTVNHCEFENHQEHVPPRRVYGSTLVSNNLCLICAICAFKSQNLYSLFVPAIQKTILRGSKNIRAANHPFPEWMRLDFSANNLCLICASCVFKSPNSCSLLFPAIWKTILWDGLPNSTKSVRSA